MKKFFSYIVAASLMCLSFTCFAEQSSTNGGDANGKCGDSLYWELNNSGVLTISGTGKMYSYEESENIPWFEISEPSEIKKVIIENGVESLSDLALYGTAISSVALPESVTELGFAALANCPQLLSVTLPDNMERLPEGLFNNDYALKYVHLPANLKYITSQAFLWCESLNHIVIPNSVTDIERNTFARCMSMESIILPEKLSKITEDTFSDNTMLTSLELPPELKTIEKSAFLGCANIEKILLPDGLTAIGASAFTWSDSERYSDTEQIVYIPSSVKEIGKAAIDERAVIYGFKDSAAEKYAAENNQKFVPVTESMYSKEQYYSKLNSQIDKVPENLTEPSFLPNTITVIKDKDTIKVFVGDKEIDCEDAAPFVDENGRTQMPIRAVAEALGAVVNWDPTTQTVNIEKGNFHMTLVIGNTSMTVDNSTTEMDTAAKIVNDRTYIPLRFVGGGLNMRVEWIQK